MSVTYDFEVLNNLPAKAAQSNDATSTESESDGLPAYVWALVVLIIGIITGRIVINFLVFSMNN